MGNNNVELPEKVTEENVPAAEAKEIITENISDADNVPEEKNTEAETAENAEDNIEENTEENTESEEASDSENNTEENPAQPKNEAAEATMPKESIFDRIKNAVNIKKILLISGISIAAAALIYFSGVLYYSNHFFFNTHIGSFNCSNLSADKAIEKIHTNIDNYEFIISDKNGNQQSITGEDIELTYKPVEDLTQIKAKQNPFAWLTDTKNRDLDLDIELTFNEERLYNLITELDCAAESRKNMDGSIAGIYYENGKYNVRDDGTKNIVSISMLFSKIKNAVNEFRTDMSLEDEGCYVGLAGDDKMKETLDTLNRYVSTKVTYTRGDTSSYLDGGSINEWLSVGEDYSVSLDKEKIAAYVNDLAALYDTIGKTRNFKSTGGQDVGVKSVTYGWLVDRKKETDELYNIIMSGEEVSREPVYKRKAAVHGADSDLLNTYVEISLAGQHLWYYRDGNLIIESNVVTGNPYKGNATPPGIYSMVYKDKNVTLKGEDYETPVSFWMPFNGGIGLHDATWRGSFGGSIYRGGGSHGCVNLPYNVAAKIYETLAPGDPIVLY